jgi:hypothetical protein
MIKKEDILYELRYRNYNLNKVEQETNISKSIDKSIMSILEDFKNIDAKDMDKIKFSDVICNVLPVFDETTHELSYKYEQIFINGKKNGDPNEYIDMFKKFDINRLPLIEVAKYLNICVEKSNILKPFGCFIPAENKIILCSDYVPTFIHELAHAIDHALPNYHYEKHFSELVAEMSAVVLCRTYNIRINTSYSMYYLNLYTNSEANINDIIERVKLIYAYIKECVQNIKNKNNGV